jgi:hypothetical protein
MRRSLAAVLVCGASAVASIALAGGGTVSTTPFDVFVTGFWDLSLPLLVTYAVVRHQLFGIDLKIKWTIKRGAVAAVFLAVIFMVSQLAQNWLSQSQGLVVGSSVAGIMLFAIAPIQRFAERLSDKALPNAKPAERMDEGERAAIYLDVARSAWRDGNITKDERRLLKELQTRLGLSAEAAQRIEDQAMA